MKKNNSENESIEDSKPKKPLKILPYAIFSAIVGIIALVLGFMTGTGNFFENIIKYTCFIVALILLGTSGFLFFKKFEPNIKETANNIQEAIKDKIDDLKSSNHSTNNSVKEITPTQERYSNSKKEEIDEDDDEDRCQNCGHEFDEEDKFCRVCGSLLNKKFLCKHCKTKLNESAKFCPNCGKKAPEKYEFEDEYDSNNDNWADEWINQVKNSALNLFNKKD